MAVLGTFGDGSPREQTGEPDTIVFCGKPIRVADSVSSMPLLRFAKAAAQGVDSASLDGLAAMYDLLRDCLDPADWPTFETLATEHKVDHEVLFSVCTTVYEAVTARPTRQGSGSSATPPVSTDSSKDASDHKASLGLVPVSALLQANG